MPEPGSNPCGPRAEGHAHFWGLDPGLTYLNHGSFGACPTAVLAAQSELRRRMEANPVGFLVRELEPLLDAAREELARFLNADPQGLAFLPNATTAVNTVVQGFDLLSGDEILTTDHEYNACRNALEAAAARAGARIVVARVPFPVSSAEEISAAVLSRVSARTRLALLDHVTSPTAIVLPVESLVAELERRGVATLVDGAHGPGMLPLDLGRLGASFYAGNCHKWICAPKGAGLLHVRADRLREMHPLVVSHGANSPRLDRTRFHLEFDWQGTQDFSPYLCVPEALRFMGALLPGGWDELRARNHALACEARRILCDALELAPPCPEAMLGSMAAIVIGEEEPGAPRAVPQDDEAAQRARAAEDAAAERGLPPEDDPLEIALYDRHRIVVPVFRWQAPRVRILRVSAQLYNAPDQYRRLAAVLKALG